MELKNEAEAPQKRIRRAVQNTWTRFSGLSFKTEKLVKIKLKERELVERKKAFGVQYMDLITSDSDEQELYRCVDETKVELAAIQQSIILLKIAIEWKEAETRAKVKAGPRASSLQAAILSCAPVEDDEKTDFIVVDEVPKEGGAY